jgi:hypothetical protein
VEVWRLRNLLQKICVSLIFSYGIRERDQRPVAVCSSLSLCLLGMTELTRCQPLNYLNTTQLNFPPSDLLSLTYSDTRTKPHERFSIKLQIQSKQYRTYRHTKMRMTKMFMNDLCEYSVPLCLRIIKQKYTLSGSIKTKFKIQFCTLLINVICLLRQGHMIHV